MADVARLAIYADLIDLTRALRLIGLERVVPAVDAVLDEALNEALETELAAIEEEEAAAEFRTQSGDDRAAREGVARAAQTLAEGWQRGANDSRGRNIKQTTDKSMIAYLLVPDNPSPEQVSLMERYDFESVPNVVRSLIEQEVVSSRQDNWKLSVRVRDASPRRHKRGGLDLRSAVRDMARLEPLNALPTRSFLSPMQVSSVLIDHSLLIGPFRADVDTFLQTLRHGGGAGAKRYVVQRVGSTWHWTDGPLWQLESMDINRLGASSLALFPGWSDPEVNDEWRSLIEQAAESDRQVSVILVGGDGGRRAADPVIGSLATDR